MPVIIVHQRFWKLFDGWRGTIALLYTVIQSLEFHPEIVGNYIQYCQVGYRVTSLLIQNQLDFGKGPKDSGANSNYEQKNTKVVFTKCTWQNFGSGLLLLVDKAQYYRLPKCQRYSIQSQSRMRASFFAPFSGSLDSFTNPTITTELQF